jgi:hypothetical protein
MTRKASFCTFHAYMNIPNKHLVSPKGRKSYLSRILASWSFEDGMVSFASNVIASNMGNYGEHQMSP